MKPLRTRQEVQEEAQARRSAKHRTPVKKRNTKRAGSRYPKRREPAYLDWLRTQRCVISGVRTGDGIAPLGHWRFAVIVPAHHPSRGAGGYDRDALPLETHVHDEQHRVGIETFCATYRLDWQAQVKLHRARYEREWTDVAGRETKAGL